MITITRPGSAYIKLNTTDDTTLSWNSTTSGQIAYEVLYRIRGTTSWNTTGKTTSTDTQYDLVNITTMGNGFEYFKEIEYCVKLYYNTTTEEGTLTGSETSDIYKLIFSDAPVTYLKVNSGRSYPLFDSVATSGSKFKVQNTSSQTLQTVLVGTDNPLAGELKVQTNDGTKLVPSSSPTFNPEMVNNNTGEWDQQVSGTYEYSYAYNYASSYYNYSVINRYYYNSMLSNMSTNNVYIGGYRSLTSSVYKTYYTYEYINGYYSTGYSGGAFYTYGTGSNDQFGYTNIAYYGYKYMTGYSTATAYISRYTNGYHLYTNGYYYYNQSYLMYTYSSGGSSYGYTGVHYGPVYGIGYHYIPASYSYGTGGAVYGYRLASERRYVSEKYTYPIVYISYYFNYAYYLVATYYYALGSRYSYTYKYGTAAYNYYYAYKT